MTAIRLRYVDRFRDRHGRARYYFRRGKGPRIPLPGLPGSVAFMAAYQLALAGTHSSIKPVIRAATGTFNRLALEYFSSPDFLRLRPHTRHVYRLVIERFLAEHGHRLVREMNSRRCKAAYGIKGRYAWSSERSAQKGSRSD